MFSINEETNEIFITRGDTGRANVIMKYENGSSYVPQTGDVIRFMVKRFYSSETVVISKNVPIDTLVFELEPNDTKGLIWGAYRYDMELTYADGDVDTFLQGILMIGEEVN